MSDVPPPDGAPPVVEVALGLQFRPVFGLRPIELGGLRETWRAARDERVPIANAESLWTELQTRGVPSRLLLFPDENHWILKPQNARLWYLTVFAFLDEHVLGGHWRRPELL